MRRSVSDSIVYSRENIVGKAENAGYQLFLLFLSCFQKISFKVVKSWYCAEKGKTSNFISNNNLTITTIYIFFVPLLVFQFSPSLRPTGEPFYPYRHQSRWCHLQEHK